MKILPILFLIIFHFNTYAQKDSLSNIEKFSSKSGSLYKTEFINVKTIARIKIEGVIKTNLIDKSGKPIKGVRISRPNLNGEYASFIDLDELNDMILSLEFLTSTVFYDSSVTNYTEVNYKSRSGVVLGCYIDSKHWKPFIQIKDYIENSITFVEQNEMGQFMESIRYIRDKVLK